MRSSLSIESFTFRLAKCVFAFSLIFVVLFKPFSSCILELNEETIELSTDVSEKDFTEECAEEFIPDFLAFFESFTRASQQERKLIAFRSTEQVSDFRLEIVLPPPEL